MSTSEQPRRAKTVQDLIHHYLSAHGKRGFRELEAQMVQRFNVGSRTAVNDWSTGKRAPRSAAELDALRAVVGCSCLEYGTENVKRLLGHSAARNTRHRAVKARFSALELLRRISDAAVEDSDIVAHGIGSILRFSSGVYVTRKVEERLLDRLTDPSVNAVVGEAGHGKTALLWRLHRELSPRALPILLPASVLVPGVGHDLASSTVDMATVRAAIEEAAQAKKRLILLVDTLDLLLNDAGKRGLVNELLTLAFQTGTRMIVTSRPVEVAHLAIDYEGGDAPAPSRALRGVTLGGVRRRRAAPGGRGLRQGVLSTRAG